MKKLLFLIPCLFLIIGCKPKYPESPSYTIIEADSVNNFIVYSNKIDSMGCTSLVDQMYAAPTIEWITKYYTPQLNQFLFDYQLNTPSPTHNECDKYSYYGVTVGHIMFHHSKTSDDTALAIGEFYYVGHAIVFFIATDADNKLKLVFYDPRTKSIIDFKPQDYDILGWRM